MGSKKNNILSSISNLFHLKHFSFFKIVLFLIFLIFIINSKSIWSFIWNMEQRLIDFRFSISQTEDMNTDIVIIDIDNSSISKIAHWPWPRNYYADAIKQLNKYGASVIGFDILFDSESLLEDADTYFSTILSEHDNVVLASRKYVQEKGSYKLETWFKPISLFSDHAPSGFINFPFDQDGNIRRAFPVLENKNERFNFSFDLLIASQYSNTPLSKIIRPLHKSILSLSKDMSLLDDYSYYINFNLSNSFTHIPFYLLLEDRLENPSILKNKIVLIGATDSSLNDYFFTPVGRIPGVELHAYSLLTLLKGESMSVFNYWVNLVFCLYLVALIGVFSRKTTAKIGFIITLFILSLYSFLVIASFEYASLILLWSPFLILGFFTYIITVFSRFIKEESDKRHIYSIFNQYVSPQVVSTLLESPSALKLGGEKKEVSVFFSDIRSFTSISENHPPELIVSQLNEYFDIMTNCIFKWKGTLDKYVGDEIMAIWGAPLQLDDHALLSLCSAWEQLQLLEKLKAKWKEENKPIFDIGIGINTGPAIVGNIGSTQQKDYTVIGDSVNYAARLQSTTRDFSDNSHTCRLIISDSTYEQTKEYCKVKALGEVAVKGKANVRPIYEVTHVDIPKTYLSL